MACACNRDAALTTEAWCGLFSSARRDGRRGVFCFPVQGGMAATGFLAHDRWPFFNAVLFCCPCMTVGSSLCRVSVGEREE